MRGVHIQLWRLLDVNAMDLSSHEEVYAIWEDGWSPEEAVNVIVADDELLAIVRRSM